MAVEIKYVVIREGEEKMSFASKKEADAYDKMLDLAEVLNDWLVASPLEMDDVQRDTMAMWLAKDIFSSPSRITTYLISTAILQPLNTVFLYSIANFPPGLNSRALRA